MKRFHLTWAASIAIGLAGCAATSENGPAPTASTRPADVAALPTTLAAAPLPAAASSPSSATAAMAVPKTSKHTASAPTCSELAASVARAEGTKRAAAEKERDAWKAVVPVAVAARYAHNRAALADAERQLVGLRAEMKRQGCDRHAS